MRPGRTREGARGKELADEARQAALQHGQPLSEIEREELERDVESLADDRQFVI